MVSFVASDIIRTSIQIKVKSVKRITSLLQTLFYQKCCPIKRTCSKILLTNILQAAFFAVCLSRRTDFSSVMNKAVAEITPFFPRNDLPQFHFYFFQVFYAVY